MVHDKFPDTNGHTLEEIGKFLEHGTTQADSYHDTYEHGCQQQEQQHRMTQQDNVVFHQWSCKHRGYGR